MNQINAITKDELEAFGFEEPEGDSFGFPMTKKIGYDTSTDLSLTLAVTTLRNAAEICLILPNGDILYLAPETIDDLIAFEACIQSWEPNY